MNRHRKATRRKSDAGGVERFAHPRRRSRRRPSSTCCCPSWRPTPTSRVCQNDLLRSKQRRKTGGGNHRDGRRPPQADECKSGGAPDPDGASSVVRRGKREDRNIYISFFLRGGIWEVAERGSVLVRKRHCPRC